MPLVLVRRPKSPYWIIRGTIRGIRIEETTGTTSKQYAEEIRAKREVELLEQSIHGRAATTTFAHAALAYVEGGGSDRFLAPVVEYFTTTLLSKIDQQAIDNAARNLFPKGAAATRNRQVYTPISAVLHYAARRKWCDKPVIERPSQPQGRIRWISPAEAERLIDAADDYFRPLLVFLFYTGARTGEALALTWDDIDLGRGHVNFPKTKTNFPRGVPLHQRVIAELKEQSVREGRVFRRRDGKPYTLPDAANRDDTSAGSRIRSPFDRACRKAGIANFTPHDCRHTFATWHYQANRDLTALMRLGGWKTHSMVLRYAHTNVSEHRHTIDALPGGKSGDLEDDLEET